MSEPDIDFLDQRQMTELAILEQENQINFLEMQMSSAKELKANLEIDLKRIKACEGLPPLGVELEEKRIKLGLQKRELCKLSNISEPAYRSLIKGTSQPREKTLKNVREVLEKRLDKLRYK